MGGWLRWRGGMWIVIGLSRWCWSWSRAISIGTDGTEHVIRLLAVFQPKAVQYGIAKIDDLTGRY